VQLEKAEDEERDLLPLLAQAILDRSPCAELRQYDSGCHYVSLGLV